MRKWVVSIIAVCLICSVLSGCARSETPGETAEITRGHLAVSVSIKDGNLEMHHKEYLSFGTMGEVDKILVEKGDKVIKGQVLARLDTYPLESRVEMAQNAYGMAQARYEMAQARYEMAQNSLMQTIYPHYTTTYATDLPGVWLALEEIQSNLDEAQKLLEQGEIEKAKALLELVGENTSRAQEKSQARVWAVPFYVKLAELQVDEARAALDMARSELAIARLESDTVRLELDKATITAPFDGIVANVYIDAGQQLSAMTHTSPAIYLVDPSEIEMSGEIDEMGISKIELGQEAIVALDALPHKRMKGKVTFISPTGKVWEDEVTYKTTITLESYSEELRDGMSATADIVTGRRNNVLLIPNRAIQGSLENPWVEVITADEVEKRQVTLGSGDGMSTEVLSGLKEGEKVVLR